MDSGITLLYTRLRTLAFASGIAAIFVSAAVLVGWGANVPWLTSLSPLVAVCFILSGFSLCLLMSRSSTALASARLARVLALVVLHLRI
jgi:hypothetical protein